METGIIDPHALIFSFLKTAFTKMLPNNLQYRNYKKFKYIHFYKMMNNYPEKLVIQNGKKIL